MVLKAIQTLCLRYEVQYASIFNGRFSPYKAALVGLQERSIPVIVHEKGKRRNTFSFLQNISFEHADLIAQEISSHKQPLCEDQRSLLHAFCKAHQTGNATNSHINYTQRYAHSSIKNIQKGEYVVYFTSSLEEKSSKSADFSIKSLINDLNLVRLACLESGKAL